ncbi:MAG: ABC transporter substrate-binding protein [Chitinophagales bacterium]
MRNIIYYLLLTGCVLLTACNGCNKGHDKNGKFFRYNQASGITSLDPAFASDQSNIWAVNNLFNSLVQLDDSLNIKPAIANRWEISEDGLTYTFHLRTDVFFHDDACFAESKGRTVNANDVVFSFKRLVDPATAAKGSWVFNGKIDTVEPFKAIDDSTFQLKLIAPFRPMLGILSMQYCSILPKEAIDKYGRDFRAHPVGTGPFVFTNWKEGVALVMLKNKNYFEKDGDTRLPYLDGIKVSFIDNTKTEFLSFKQGDLDFISGIDGAYIDEMLDDDGEPKAEWKEKFSFYKSSYLNTEYLCFLMKGEKDNVLLNKKVRQAINYGFKRDELVKYLRNGIGTPATHGFVPGGFADYDNSSLKGYGYNPDLAAKLLAEAGYAKGKGLPEIKLYTSDFYKEYALNISKQLQELGIVVKVELTQSSLLKEMKASGKAPFFRASLIADYSDPETYLAAFYSKNIAPPNYSRFSNAQFDELYEKAVAEQDLQKRNEMYLQMERIIIEEAPIVPLYYDEVLRLSQKNVSGLSPNALNILNLKRVQINQ